jgi:hypothetical protein
MPIKRRVSKRRAFTLTPEVFGAFDAGDEYELRRALGLPPWHASPLDTDLAGPAPYGPATCWAMSPARLRSKFAVKSWRRTSELGRKEDAWENMADNEKTPQKKAVASPAPKRRSTDRQNRLARSKIDP